MHCLPYQADGAQRVEGIGGQGGGKIYVCQHGGQYTPVVLMVGRYRGSMEAKSLENKFYNVEHKPGYLNEHDRPLGV